MSDIKYLTEAFKDAVIWSDELNREQYLNTIVIRFEELEAQLKEREWISVEPNDNQLNEIGRGKFLAEIVYEGEAITATTVDAVMFDIRTGWLLANKGSLKPSVKQWTHLPSPPTEKGND